MAKTRKKSRVNVASHRRAVAKATKNSKSRTKKARIKKAKHTLKKKLKKVKPLPKKKPLRPKLKTTKTKAGKTKSQLKKQQVIVKEALAPRVVKKELSKEMLELLSRAQARYWLVELAGENALDVIKHLPAIPNDEELAKKLMVKVSDVRASLNKLHSEGLVTYAREKNSETGWYSYSWLLNEDKIKKWVKEREVNHDVFKPQEGVDIYFCKDCGPKSIMHFEHAMEHLFKCPLCNSPLEYLDEEKFEQFKKFREGERVKP